MKFLVIFLISAVALATALDEKPRPREVKAVIEKYIEETGMTCDNHKSICNKEINISKTTGLELKGPIPERCLTIFNQYLCEGKKEGIAFADVYQDFIEMLSTLGHL